MKIINFILILLTLLIVSCSKNEDANKNSAKTEYTCPMHPEVISDKPGICPICKMDLVKKVKEEKHADEYTCPMHPEVKSDKPGICPICKMDLVKKTHDHSETGSAMSNELHLSASKQALANTATIKVKKENITKEIRAYSYLEFPEQNRKIISARFNGRIEKLFVNKTGDKISAGQPLFEIYSPDLAQIQKEFMMALNNNGPDKKFLVESAKKKLSLLGVTDKQLDELEKTKTVKSVITFYSPSGGVILEKKILEGMYVNEGAQLYEIVDLSTLWNLADIYESDLASVKNGDKINLKIDSFPGEVFEGRINYIYPNVNTQSRTVTIRAEIANKNGKLRQQMRGITYFNINLSNGLTVPENAVILTGKKNIVWIKTPSGTFEQKEVQLGIKFNGKYQVTSGLSEGDEIVSSGGFLIDSESRLMNTR